MTSTNNFTFHCAIGNAHEVKKYIDSIKHLRGGGYFNRGLIVAAKNNKLEIVKMIMDVGVSPYALHGTAFVGAANNGQLDCIKEMISREGLPNDYILKKVINREHTKKKYPHIIRFLKRMKRREKIQWI
jgi:hypothetical protein